MRKLLVAAVALLLLLPGAAAAKTTTETATAGGITATFSYRNGPGPETTDERLKILAPGMSPYDEPVPARGCLKVCSPASPDRAVHVLDLYGDGQYEVVLDLFTGGASCCGLEQVYVPSASIGSWVLTERNFGQDGARIETLSGRVRFVSGDNAFACEFADCAESGLPIQIFAFTGDAFHNLTRAYPTLIRRDAAVYWKAYLKDHDSGRVGLIAAWAADEDNLGRGAAAQRTLLQQVREHRIGKRFVNRLDAFLKRHGYRH